MIRLYSNPNFSFEKRIHQVHTSIDIMIYQPAIRFGFSFHRSIGMKSFCYLFCRNKWWCIGIKPYYSIALSMAVCSSNSSSALSCFFVSFSFRLPSRSLSRSSLFFSLSRSRSIPFPFFIRPFEFAQQVNNSLFCKQHRHTHPFISIKNLSISGGLSAFRHTGQCFQ